MDKEALRKSLIEMGIPVHNDQFPTSDLRNLYNDQTSSGLVIQSFKPVKTSEEAGSWTYRCHVIVRSDSPGLLDETIARNLGPVKEALLKHLLYMGLCVRDADVSVHNSNENNVWLDFTIYHDFSSALDEGAVFAPFLYRLLER